MPDEPAFTMSYPAYVLKDNAGRPELVEIDGNVCVALFSESRRDAQNIAICRAKKKDAVNCC